VETTPDRDPEKPVSILIVDDRKENRAALRAILASPAYHIVEVSSATEALLALLREDFAVLLVDVVMPELSGFDLAAAVRQRPRTASTPIIFLTAQASDMELVYRGYRAGAVDYLVKPLVPEMVRAKVAVFAELCQQRRRIERQGVQLLDAARWENEHRLLDLRLAEERRYRGLAEAIPQIVWTAGPDGRADYFNRRWFEYTLMSPEQTASSWFGAVHPDDLPVRRVEWEKARAAGETIQAEFRLRRGDGVYRWHLWRAVPERDSTGQVAGWVGTFTDIQDQKRVEEVLAEFKGTLDAVLDAVLIIDPGDLHFLYVNDGARVLWGYRARELARMRPFELMVDVDEPRFREHLAPLSDGTRNAITFEAPCRRKDGRTIPVEFGFQIVPVDGRHLVSIARDITSRKLAEMEREQLYEEALAAIRARDEFLSIASHELRTPLSSLQLVLETLVNPPASAPPPSPERVREKLATALRQVSRLGDLITELLDMSRITAGRLKLERERVDLAVLARDVVGRFKEDASKAGSEVSIEAPEAVSGLWDALRIEQVITNLLANALKFGAGRPIGLTVEQEDGHAILSVRDHGIGIHPEDIERVFLRYERAVSSRAYGGLGLGLYIARQIVEAHGGTIRVESQPGAGSTFFVELPLEPPPREHPDERGEVTAPPLPG
jgi:PAS domain S-box-containing protein